MASFLFSINNTGLDTFICPSLYFYMSACVYQATLSYTYFISYLSHRSYPYYRGLILLLFSTSLTYHHRRIFRREITRPDSWRVLYQTFSNCQDFSRIRGNFVRNFFWPVPYGGYLVIPSGDLRKAKIGTSLPTSQPPLKNLHIFLFFIKMKRLYS